MGQIPIEQKSNQIPALKPLLKKLALPPGTLVTLVTTEAMHCQQESARFVTPELGGDYLFGLKGNQSGILEKAQHLLAQQGVWDKGHGRLDRRRLARVEVSPESIGLGGCWQVIAVERTSQDTADLDAAPSSDIGCYATSLTLDQHTDPAILEIIRGHWSAI